MDLAEFDDTVEAIAEALASDGLIVIENAMPVALTDRLRQRIRDLDEAYAGRPAGVGRGARHRLNESIRTDRIVWLEGKDPAESAYLDWMEQLRRGLNQRLFLGLFDYECHFAVYPPGAYYRRHLDAFQGQRNRIVTTVFYLNADWDARDGGELLIYDQPEQQPLRTVTPDQGTLVVFLSDRYPHEVLPSQRTRYSIAGWMGLNRHSAGKP